jgi:hypothetical protein
MLLLEKTDAIRIFVKIIRILTTKLTLSIDHKVIERAKRYAKSTGRSLSAIIESYLAELVQEDHGPKASASLMELLGAVHLPANFDEKKARLKHIEQKHL